MCCKTSVQAAVSIVLGVTSALAHAQGGRYEKTIPPEILVQYDKRVVQGLRPKAVTITQSMIWPLRTKPDQGGEVYRLDFSVSELSTVQKEILSDWVKKGQRILLWGKDEIRNYAPLFSEAMQADYKKRASDSRTLNHPAEHRLAAHPVNTDVRDLEVAVHVPPGSGWIHYYYWTVITRSPKETEVILSTREGVIAGKVPYGKGGIYFLQVTGGADVDRWKLNFYQWMLGLPVPGSASVKSKGGPPSATVDARKVDTIRLRNGDTLSGKLLTDAVKIETSYASLEFTTDQIDAIEMEGGSQQTDVLLLRNGDRLSGVIGPDRIQIELTSGQKAVIEKDKIKQVNIRR